MKGYHDPSILCAVLLFGAVLVSPAFADMKMVDDKELSRVNASVTGASIKDTVADVDRNTLRQETLQVSETVTRASVKDQNGGVANGTVSLETLQASGTTLDKDKVAAVLSSSVNKTLEGIGIGGLNIGGVTPFQSSSDGVNINNITGSVSVKLR